MSTLRPAPDAQPAEWLLSADVWWWDLVRYGPPGFEVYVRVAFADAAEPDPPGELPALRTTLELLAAHTRTPEVGYACVWEGWIGDPVPVAPVVPVPYRTMRLFTGAIEVLRDAPSLAWFGEPSTYQEPHFVWPQDRAWCVACEVDEEIEFTVGCSREAARALAEALPGTVRELPYGAETPRDRDTD